VHERRWTTRPYGAQAGQGWIGGQHNGRNRRREFLEGKIEEQESIVITTRGRGRTMSGKQGQVVENAVVVGSMPCRISSEVHVNGRHVTGTDADDASAQV
jgi:hypothetical protein